MANLLMQYSGGTFYLPIITAKSPFFIFSQMVNQSQQQNTSSSLALFSASECIAWRTVFGMEAAATMTLNALAIIVYLKERSLRKSSIYLVINLAVADMFVGASVFIECWILGGDCDWTINLFSDRFKSLFFALLNVFPMASLVNLAAISLERTHATFRPFNHRFIKKKVFGAAVVIVWITAGLISTSVALIGVLQLLTFSELWYISDMAFMSISLFCLLIVVVSYSSMAKTIVCGTQPNRHGVTSRERKLTKTLFIATVASLLLTLPDTILHILDRAESSISTMISPRTRFRIHFSFNFLFFCKLSCQSSSLYI